MIESEKERGSERGKKNGSEKRERGREKGKENGKEKGNGSGRESENVSGSEKGPEKEKRNENGKENGKIKTRDAMTGGRSARMFMFERTGSPETATRRESPRNAIETKGVPAPGSPPSAGGSTLPTVTPTTVGMTKMKSIDS